MCRRQKQVSQQGWKIYSRVEETFLATNPHGFLPSQIYSTHSIISSSLQQPSSWSGARESHTVSPPALPSPQGGLPVPGKCRHRKFSTPHFLWLCTKAGTVSVPALTPARVSGLCFNEKTRARTALRYGALMRREQR